MMAGYGNSSPRPWIPEGMVDELLAITAAPGMADITVLLGAMLAVSALARFILRPRA